MYKKIILIASCFLISCQSAGELGLIAPKEIVPNITTTTDIDRDGIDDISDLLAGARAEVENQTNYKSVYYAGGYPPKDEGVCTDVIWRAFQEMGVDLKILVDADIGKNTSKYPRVAGKPDPNIDFRRTPNLEVFFERNALSLTKEIIPENRKNLEQWQPGDIVIFGKPKGHIAIISDKRNAQGVPFMIHNSAPVPREDDWLVYWSSEVSPIVGHYRWKYNQQ